MNNIDRALRAREAAIQHGDKGEDLDTLVYDLLANLCHLCRIEGLEFDRLCSLAVKMAAVEACDPDNVEN